MTERPDLNWQDLKDLLAEAFMQGALSHSWGPVPQGLGLKYAAGAIAKIQAECLTCDWSLNGNTAITQCNCVVYLADDRPRITCDFCQKKIRIVETKHDAG